MYIMLRRVASIAFVAVSGGGRRLLLWSFQLLRRATSAGAVVALLFHVVIFGQRGNEGRSGGQLADAVEDDFGAPVIELDRAVNFDGLAGEAADIADVFQIGSKHDDGERAGHLIFTEVDEVNALRSDFHAYHFAGDAFGLADMLAGCRDGEAVGGGRVPRKNQYQKRA